jgi:putative DNA primase/helicase
VILITFPPLSNSRPKACRGWDNAREIWEKWSGTSTKFYPDEIAKKWDSFNSDKGLTVKTIFGMAGEVGWTNSPSLNPAADWREPEPFNKLPSVMPFDPLYLPDAIAPWVMDFADRMQCDPALVAVPAIIALGSVIGRKIAIRPQIKTDWYEIPNLWGCIVARPGFLKSPSMEQALAPIFRLDLAARDEYTSAIKAHAIDAEAFKLRKDVAQGNAKAALKKGDNADISAILDLDEPEAPKQRRYVFNDTSYEALGVILADNPNGVMAYKDELISLLKSLGREEASAARGFFLTAWSGKSGYTCRGFSPRGAR